MVVWARPGDHDAIKKAIEEMSKREPLENAPRVEVYQVESVGAQAAISFLTPTFSDAQFTAGSEPNKLMVRARPADHELIKAAIEQMETAVREIRIAPWRSIPSKHAI